MKSELKNVLIALCGLFVGALLTSVILVNRDQSISINKHIKDIEVLNNKIEIISGELNKYKTENSELRAELKSLSSLKKLKDDLRKLSRHTNDKNKIATTIALGFTETNLDHKAKHKQKGIVGICGADKRDWEATLQEQNIPINSLMTCLAIYEYYLDETNDPKKAIKKYKGIKSNKHIGRVYIVEKLKVYIIHNLDEDILK